MKNFVAILIGSIIIAIAILIAGENIPNPSYPSTLSLEDNGSAVNAIERNSYYNDTFLTESEAAAFLKIPKENLTKLLQENRLSQTYMVINDQKIFSKSALSEFMRKNIEEGNVSINLE